MQIRIKVQAEGFKLLTLANAVVYIGLFLTGEPLKWFKFYFFRVPDKQAYNNELRSIIYVFKLGRLY